MRVLLVTPFLPDADAHSGAPRAVYDRVAALARTDDVEVVCFAEPDGPTPHSVAGARIVAVPPPRRGTVRKRFVLALGLVLPTRPMLVQEFRSRAMVSAVAAAARRMRPDVVLVEHVLAAQYGATPAIEAPVVVSEHDAATTLRAEHEVPIGPVRRLIDRYETVRWRRYAHAVYRRARAVTVPTEADAALVRRAVSRASVSVIPFGDGRPRPDEHDDPSLRVDDELLFVGNFDHPPNRDAAVWLAHEILPSIRRRHATARLRLVGRNPTDEIRALAGDGVEVTGEVPSVEPFLRRCTVFVAPLRQGGGMRMKLLDALAAGTPIVTTTVGAAGLAARPGHHLEVADGTEPFAAAVVRLLTDPAARDRLSAAAPSALTDDRTRVRALRALLESTAREARR
ncbi:MAG: glycosyltransferase [Jatrophihabitans sp.]|uniref:glycosyltransferase n=1 Tax=Jatrophihabitans sp. TaxID=1932789 RepID=UPI003F7CE730